MSQKSTRPQPHAAPVPPPRHVGVIMDGNGRWAKARGLPRVEGHRQGIEALRRTLRAAQEFGIAYLTVYAFSSENWSRPAAEVSALMGFLKLFIRRDLADLHARNVRIRVIGEREGLARDVARLLDEAESLTRTNGGLTFVVAFNYGARHEMVRAAQRLAQKAAAGALAPEAIDEAMVAAELSTADLPDPDLIIRTSGEQRLSNFLLWQAAYAEFVFQPIHWPDYGAEALAEALALYAGRERRYGALGEAHG